MDLPTDQHQQHQHQEMASDETLESMLECRKAQQQEKKAKPVEESLKCPRCDSINTKFCYYNNYSLTQPRYFCKSCRRYWTKGGTLRNVPVGGGCRKNNKRSSSISSSSSSKRVLDQAMISSPNPYNNNNNNNNNNPLSSLITGLSSYDQSDHITLAIARLQNQNQNHHFEQMGFGGQEHGFSIFGNNTNNHDVNDDVNAMRGGYFENPYHHHHHHQLFGGNMGQNENGGFIRNLGLINGSEELMGNSSMGYNGDQEIGDHGCGIPTTTTVTTVKQEGENRLVMAGFPWQFGEDQTGHMVDYEPAPVKPIWNGFGSSSWHGLLNSPLM